MASRDRVDEIAAAALARFDLPRPTIRSHVGRAARNVALLVEDAYGSRFVLRAHLRNPSKRRIEFQLGLQEHLARSGFPTPRVISTRAGEDVVAVDGVLWSLFPFVEGAPCNAARPAHVHAAAEELAHLHTAAESFAAAEVRDETIPAPRQWWWEGEHELERLAVFFRGAGVERELEELRRWHGRLLEAFPPEHLEELPRAWVHGDYHAGNLVFAGDRVAGVFDFDVVHRGLRVEDVAQSLHAFAPGDEFIASYHATIHLEPAELQALPAMASAVQVRTAKRYELRRRAGEDPAQAFRTHVARVRALELI